MRKRITAIISVLVMLLSLFLLPACNWFEGWFATAQAEAVGSNGKSYPVVNLTQTAWENKNYLDTEVSWYDENYNYYVYHIGNISNVPLTTTYTVFTHDEGNVSYTREIVKTTESSIELQTAKNLTSTVAYSSTTTANVELSVSGTLKKKIDVGVEAGFTKSITNDVTKTESWSESVTSCVTTSTQEKSVITLTFNNSCKRGIYLFLHLGYLKVFGAIIQSRSNPSEIYAQTYSSIEADQYTLHYSGDNPYFPIDEQKKLNFDLSFVSELEPPTKMYEAPKEDVAPPKTSTTIVLGSGAADRHAIRLWHSWGHDDDWSGKDEIHPELNRDRLLLLGYTKIKVSMTFHYRVDDWGDQLIQIFSNDNQEVRRFTFEWDERGWSRQTLEFELALGNQVGSDCGFWIKWYLSKDGNNSDTWFVGGTTLLITASK